MLSRHSRILVAALFAVTSSASPALAGDPVSQAISYQGRLTQSGSPVNGSADLQFTLYDGSEGGAAQVGSTVEIINATIADGVFTAELDFGAAPGTFDGSARWLEIAARVPHDPSDTLPFTTLTPRQPLRPAPYALYALTAPPAALPAGGSWELTANLSIDNNTLYIDQAGNRVGLGRVPLTNRLEVEGNASKSAAGSWSSNSDARIKTGVETVADALETLNQVRLVGFRYTPQYLALHPAIDNIVYYNVIAQEFAEVFPDSVQSSGEALPERVGGRQGRPWGESDDEVLQVDIHPLIIHSAAAIQELNKRLEAKAQELESKISSVSAENAELRQRLMKLEQTVEQLQQQVSKNGGSS